LGQLSRQDPFAVTTFGHREASDCPQQQLTSLTAYSVPAHIIDHLPDLMPQYRQVVDPLVANPASAQSRQFRLGAVTVHRRKMPVGRICTD
jgi:hypothetical protein